MALSQQKLSTQAKYLEISMRLHETQIQDPNLGFQQIHAQLIKLCLEMQSLKQAGQLARKYAKKYGA